MREAGSIRKAVRTSGQYKGVKPRKLPSGRLTWPRAQVLASLPGAELTPGEREAWTDLKACTGPLNLSLDEQKALLTAVYNVPHEQRHNIGRLLAQSKLTFNTLQVFDRGDFTHRRDRDGLVTSLSPEALTWLAESLAPIIDLAMVLQTRFADAAGKGGV